MAIPSLTATAAANSPYAPFTKVLLYALLTTFTSQVGVMVQSVSFPLARDQVSVTKDNYAQYCTNTINQYSEIAYQVMMTIYAGDCGVLVFGYNDVNNLYVFEVRQNALVCSK